MTTIDESNATEPERQATLAKYGHGVVCGTFYDYMVGDDDDDDGEARCL